MKENKEQFLLIYQKDSMMSFYLTKVLEGQGQFVRNGLVNREIVIDTVGPYTILHSMDTDVENITDLLCRHCLGFSIRELKEEPEIKEIEPQSLQDKEKVVRLQHP
jgi:hypothetical protein